VKTLVTVREYAQLTTADVAKPSLDCARVSISAFDWLCKLNARMRSGGATLIELEDRRSLRLDNFVGVLETPCGTRVEILPKHFEEGDCIRQSRRLLCRMIAAAMNLSPREAGESALELFDAPLSEWVVARFLAALDHLVKRGVRSDYVRVESAERFLRGQLDVVRQMRQPPGREHVFNIRHDIFVPDRAENRLLKRALDHVAMATQRADNWRLAHELKNMLSEITASTDVRGDFAKWRTDRLMAHYQAVKPWCELVLYRQMPWSVSGDWHGVSMLFPMEKLFERYVARALRRNLMPDVTLAAQTRSEWLCQHEGRGMFELRPDFLVSQGNARWVLDTKWKRIDTSRRSNNYDIKQSDLYQLFGYGHKYLAGRGEMALIYPKWSGFDHPLAPFHYGGGLSLWALPFDLDASECGDLVHDGRTTLPVRPPPVNAGPKPVASDVDTGVGMASS
jgi:5-methylcytosine-specific restriction enzyme subunit McrC